MRVNKNMSNKSLFEKLFEEVMESDEQALGIEPSSEGGLGEEGGGDFGDEAGGDQVTLTLDRSTAQALYDMLGGVLGGGEEEMGGEEGGSEEFGEEGKAEDAEYGDESAENWDKEEKDEDSEESDDSDESEDSEEGLHEAPQAKYENFPNKGESLRNRNQVVNGALAAKTSGQGKAEKTSQTPGTEKYMPASTKYDDGKSMKANGRAANVSGPGKSVFHP